MILTPFSFSILLLSAGCTGIFFVPSPSRISDPEEIGLDYTEFSFPSTDGVRLAGWWIPAQGPARGTVCFFHGNAGNISYHLGSVYWLPSRGFNVLMFDYRGYGASSGSPSVGGAMFDGEAAIREAASRSKVPIIVYGQSLGGAIAISAVAHSENRERIRALVSEASFASYRGIIYDKARQFWWGLPFGAALQFLVTAADNPVDNVAAVAPVPLLLVHGTEDIVVPVTHSEQLFERANTPKELWEVGQAGHISIFTAAPERDRLIAFLDRVLTAEVRGLQRSGNGEG